MNKFTAIEVIEIIRAAQYELEQAQRWATDGFLDVARTHLYKAEGLLILISSTVYIVQHGLPREDPERLEWDMLLNTLKLASLVSKAVYALAERKADQVREILGL